MIMGFISRIVFGIPIALADAQSVVSADTTDTGALKYILSKIPLYLTAIVIFLIFLVISYLAKRWVEGKLASKIEEEHQEILIVTGRMSFVVVIFVGSTVALSIAGIDLTGLLAACAFGLSFGLQDTIANFVAGIGILASQPFKLGDYIKVNGVYGKVVEIRTRATYINTPDGYRVIVPNAELYKNMVTGVTTNPMRRVKVPIYIRYGVNLKEVYKIIYNHTKKHKKILQEPKPNIVIADMYDYYIELTLRFWMLQHTGWFQMKSQMFGEIQELLEQAGLDAPYPVTSLSTEEYIETGVLKTQPMNDNEVKAWVTQREKMNANYAKRYQELLRECDEQLLKPMAVADMQGASFIQSANFPIASAVAIASAKQFAAQPEKSQVIAQTDIPSTTLAPRSPDGAATLEAMSPAQQSPAYAPFGSAPIATEQASTLTQPLATESSAQPQQTITPPFDTSIAPQTPPESSPAPPGQIQQA
jgi:small conductance mechanosensitive channel